MNAKIKLSIYLLAMLAWGSSACSDDMKLVELKVTPVTSQSTKVVGDTVYVLRNGNLTFEFSGNPNYISFYSGELGKQYSYRERKSLSVSNPVLNAQVSRNLGISAATAATYTSDDYQKFGLRLYWSSNMPDLSGNFVADSTALAQATWNELKDGVTINGFKPEHFDPMTRAATFYNRGPYNLSSISGKFKIAIFAKGNPKTGTTGSGSADSQTYTIQNFKLDASDAEAGITRSMTAVQLNFKSLMTYGRLYEKFYNEKVGRPLKDLSTEYKLFNPYWFYRTVQNTTYPYWAAMPNTGYLWNMNNASLAANPNFSVTGGTGTNVATENISSGLLVADNPLWTTHGYESWLISKDIDFSNFECAPDLAIALKNASVKMTNYTYVYPQKGKYKATFVPSDFSINKSVHGAITEFNIQVVDVLP